MVTKKTGPQLISDIIEPWLNEAIFFQTPSLTELLNKYKLETWPERNYEDNTQYISRSNQGTKLTVTYAKSVSEKKVTQENIPYYLSDVSMCETNRGS